MATEGINKRMAQKAGGEAASKTLAGATDVDPAALRRPKCSSHLWAKAATKLRRSSDASSSLQRHEVHTSLESVHRQAQQGTAGEHLEALSSKVDANDASLRVLRERVEVMMEMLQELHGAMKARSKRRAQRLPSTDDAVADDAPSQGGRTHSRKSEHRSRRRPNYGVLNRIGEPGLPLAGEQQQSQQSQTQTPLHRTEQLSDQGGVNAFLSTGSMATVSDQMSPSDERDEVRAVPSEPSFSSPFDA